MTNFLSRIFLFCALSVSMFISLHASATTMEGEFVWARGKKDIKGLLKAVFTPNGDNKWDVVFNFDWRKKPKIYKGTATGEIVDGKLVGKVLNENKKRIFSFSADMKSGKLNGKHWEIKKRKGKENKISTGSFSMTTVKQ